MQPLCWLLDTAQRKQWAWAGQWAPSCSNPQTWTDGPWAAWRRFVHSSLVPWALPLFDGVATLEIAEELYSTPHELVHWHESGLLGSTKPADQLVANIGEPGNSLKEISDAFVQVCLCTVCVIGALLRDDVCPFNQTFILKTLTHQVKQCWTIVLLSIRELSQFCYLKLGSMYARKYSVPNQAGSGVKWPVISLAPFLKEILIRLGCFKPSSIWLSGMPSAPKDVQQVYQLSWGLFCALIRSDIVTFLACFDLSP